MVDISTGVLGNAGSGVARTPMPPYYHEDAEKVRKEEVGRRNEGGTHGNQTKVRNAVVRSRKLGEISHVCLPLVLRMCYRHGSVSRIVWVFPFEDWNGWSWVDGGVELRGSSTVRNQNEMIVSRASARFCFRFAD